MPYKNKIGKFIPKFLKKPLSKAYRYFYFLKDYSSFKRFDSKRFKLNWSDRYPQLFDKTAETKFDAHYIYHPAWAARIVKRINPKFHIDISSTLTFSTILSAFIPVKFYDYRPANLRLSGLSSEKGDLQNLPFEDESVDCISCMHTIEHIGLGRYGDPIDPEGDLKAIKELSRVTAIGGNLLFVVPIGKPKIMFNAHRIYSYDQIISYFPQFRIEEFSLIPDAALNTGMIENATKRQSDEQRYGCGCFWLKKIK